MRKIYLHYIESKDKIVIRNIHIMNKVKIQENYENAVKLFNKITNFSRRSK